MNLTQRDIDYVIWQNRALDFYLAARVLYQAGILRAAAFNAVQALELLLKATLRFYDRGFDSLALRHRMASMIRSVHNKAPGGASVSIPRYFYEQQRYHSLSRYPSGGRGLLVPASFVSDLDAAFCGLVKLVPFQRHTELRRLLANPDRKARSRLTRGNAMTSALRRFLRVKVRTAPRTND